MLHLYNPDAGDWFWVKYKADGSIAAEGKVNSCISCHSAVKANDYIFTEAE
ncbi:MAG: cytochrome P460 family protein [Deltaproteobacteria bacterium]|nr:cytochrome P460 family protein [Deltaproteobacteria bacterium]